MSTTPENEFDLEKLFLPAWAQESPSTKRYEKFQGGEDRGERGQERRGSRPFQQRGDSRRDRPQGRSSGPDRRDGPRRSNGPGRFSNGERPGFRRDDNRERREPPAQLPDINVTLLADDKGVESLARQIKMTGRAYPLFDIAQMILQKPERHTVTFQVKKDAGGKIIQPLFVCALDDSLWISEDEAVAGVLKNQFATFYQAEKTATEPPKGKYTFVAQCGISGVILGPPNYHDYQNQLRKLHAERFSRMQFEDFKSRVKIVPDEEVVKKWIEERSWKTEYVCLNMPEPLRLGSMAEVEKHFREVHKDTIIKPVESHTLSGTASRALGSRELARLVRAVWEDQRRFPLQIATSLSQQFASHGLQFFKVNKTITHVCVARPHFLDLETTPVSDGVKRIVEYINANPKSTRRKVIEALAPPAPINVAVTPDTNAPSPQTGSAEPTADQTAVNADLHWLIHQGHVLEFANGVLEMAKKPLPRPLPKQEQKKAEPTAPDAVISSESAPTIEPVTATSIEVPPAVPVAPEIPAQEIPSQEIAAS